MSWLERARCLGAADANDATGTVEEQYRFIARYCRHCEVTQQCGEYGGNWPGVYGGLTKKTRSDRAGRVGRPA